MRRKHLLLLLFLVFIILAVGIVAAGSLLYRNQRESCRREKLHELDAVADLKVSQISMWRRERQEDAGVFYQNNAFSALVRRLKEHPDDSDAREEIRSWIGRLQVSYHYDQVTLLDAACEDWISVPEEKALHSTVRLADACQSISSGRIVFSDFYQDETIKRVFLRLFVPILDERASGQPLGVLKMRIDPETDLYRFLQRWPTPSATAETLLIRREGDEAVFLNELRFQKNTALAFRVPLTSSDRLAVKAALGQEGAVEGVGYRRAPVLGVIRAVPDSPWFLVTTIDLTEVYAPMRERLCLTILFVAAVLSALAVAGGFLWQRQYAALYRKKYESEEKFRLHVENSFNVIFTLDKAGTILFVSPAWERHFGYPANDAQGKHFAQFVHPDDVGPCAEYLERVMSTGQSETSPPYRVQRADGTWVWILANGTRYVDTDGQFQFIGVGLDITERKNAEDALRKSNARYELVLQGASGGIWDWDVPNKRVHFSSGWKALRGYADDEIGDSETEWSSGIHPEDAPRVTAAIATHLAGQTDFFEEEYRVRRKDGTYIWVLDRGKAIRDAAGQILRMAGSELDITERKRAEERQLLLLKRLEGVNLLQEGLLLPESLERKCKMITDAAVAMLDLDFCRIWQIRPGDLCSSGCIHAAVSDEGHACRHREHCLHLVASSGRYVHLDGDHRRVPFGCYKIGRIASGEEDKFLTNCVTEDPRVHDHEWAQRLGLVSFAGYRLHDAEGKPMGVLAMFAKHPIFQEDDAFLTSLAETTSRVFLDQQAADSLREAQKLALAASRAKSEFLANMSHEIRTPMTAILGFAEILAGNPTPEEAAEAVQIIRDSGRSLLQLINDILDLSKIEAGKYEIHRVACFPRQVAADVLSIMKVRADSKNLSLTFDIIQPVPERIWSDPDRLRQILVNLVGNAIKFTEAGGVRVVMQADASPDGQSRLRFDVIDTGIGMTAEQAAMLFQPFTQVDTSVRRRFNGTGLGLAISKRLAELLDGTIEVTTAPGQGSTFCLTISTGPPEEPLPQAEPDGLARSAAPPTGQHALYCRVLLAEDGLVNQRLVTLMLAKAGAEVVVADNGQAAVELALAAAHTDNPFAIVLMDMQMPILDGYAATRMLRDAGFVRPIIALTAHAMPEDRQRCLDVGCNDYISKPIDRVLLLDTVAQYVGRQMARDV